MYLEVSAAEGFEWLFVRNDADREILRTIDVNFREDLWRPFRVFRDRPGEHLKGQPADFPWFDYGLAMRASAAGVLHDLLAPNGSLLPLETEDDVELFVFHARAVDALDAKNSKIWKFPGSERIMDVKKPVLFESAIQGADIVRLCYPGSTTFVSERFVKRVTDAHLLGWKFDPVTAH